jgi:hypothetical protein
VKPGLGRNRPHSEYSDEIAVSEIATLLQKSIILHDKESGSALEKLVVNLMACLAHVGSDDGHPSKSCCGVSPHGLWAVTCEYHHPIARLKTTRSEIVRKPINGSPTFAKSVALEPLTS